MGGWEEESESIEESIHFSCWIELRIGRRRERRKRKEKNGERGRRVWSNWLRNSIVLFRSHSIRLILFFSQILFFFSSCHPSWREREREEREIKRKREKTERERGESKERMRGKLCSDAKTLITTVTDYPFFLHFLAKEEIKNENEREEKVEDGERKFSNRQLSSHRNVPECCRGFLKHDSCNWCQFSLSLPLSLFYFLSFSLSCFSLCPLDFSSSLNQNFWFRTQNLKSSIFLFTEKLTLIQMILNSESMLLW